MESKEIRKQQELDSNLMRWEKGTEMKPQCIELKWLFGETKIPELNREMKLKGKILLMLTVR